MFIKCDDLYQYHRDTLLVDPLATYNPQPLENLTRYMTYMDFPGYASSFAPRHFPENVIVTYPPYVRDLLRLIEETDSEVIQVEWYPLFPFFFLTHLLPASQAYLVTQAALQLSPYLGPNTFPWKVVNEFNQLLNGIKRGTPIDREEWCLARVEESLGFLTGHFFVQEAFSMCDPPRFPFKEHINIDLWQVVVPAERQRTSLKISLGHSIALCLALNGWIRARLLQPLRRHVCRPSGI
jgi:Peptidase family M13